MMKNGKQCWFPQVLALTLGIIYLSSYLSLGTKRDISSEIIIGTAWVSFFVSILVKKKHALYYLITNLIGLAISIPTVYVCYVALEGFLIFILKFFISPVLLITFIFFLCSKKGKDDEDNNYLNNRLT